MVTECAKDPLHVIISVSFSVGVLQRSSVLFHIIVTADRVVELCRPPNSGVVQHTALREDTRCKFGFPQIQSNKSQCFHSSAGSDCCMLHLQTGSRTYFWGKASLLPSSSSSKLNDLYCSRRLINLLQPPHAAAANNANPLASLAVDLS